MVYLRSQLARAMACLFAPEAEALVPVFGIWKLTHILYRSAMHRKRLFQIPLNDRSGAKFGFRPWLHHAEFTSSELTTSTSNIATVVDIVVTVILARSDSISCVTMFCTVESWAEAEMPKNQTEKADSADPKPNAIGANPT